MRIHASRAVFETHIDDAAKDEPEDFYDEAAALTDVSVDSTEEAAALPDDYTDETVHTPSTLPANGKVCQVCSVVMTH